MSAKSMIKYRCERMTNIFSNGEMTFIKHHKTESEGGLDAMRGVLCCAHSPSSTNGINLIKEQHGTPIIGSFGLGPRPVEQISYGTFGFTNEFGQNVGRTDGNEGGGGFSGHGAG